MVRGRSQRLAVCNGGLGVGLFGGRCEQRLAVRDRGLGLGLVVGGLGLGDGGLVGLARVGRVRAQGRAYERVLERLDGGRNLFLDVDDDGVGLLDDLGLWAGVSAGGDTAAATRTCCLMAYSSASLPGASSLARRDCSVASSRWYMASSLMRRVTEPVLMARVVGGAIVDVFGMGDGDVARGVKSWDQLGGLASGGCGGCGDVSRAHQGIRTGGEDFECARFADRIDVVREIGRASCRERV